MTTTMGQLRWPVTAAEAAANGALWFDRHTPGWYNGEEADRFWAGHLDVNTLDLANGSACTLAQLSGVHSYDTGLALTRRLVVPDFPEDAFYANDGQWQAWYDDFNPRKLGFEVGDSRYDYAELTRAWRHEIGWRRERDAQAAARRAQPLWRRVLAWRPW